MLSLSLEFSKFKMLSWNSFFHRSIINFVFFCLFSKLLLFYILTYKKCTNFSMQLNEFWHVYMDTHVTVIQIRVSSILTNFPPFTYFIHPPNPLHCANHHILKFWFQLFCIYPDVGLLGYMLVVLFLNFWGTFIMFSY